MFRYDKDMERVMMEKKKEILLEMEDVKKRILEELHCVNRSGHESVCKLIAGYNRLQTVLEKSVSDMQKTIEEKSAYFSTIIGETYNTYVSQHDELITEIRENSTPKKGVDYWNEQDIAEIKSYVDDAILNGSW